MTSPRRACGARFAFGLAAFGLSAVLSYSDQNWPQWRGPTSNGVAAEGNPPITWSESNNVRWKVKIPGRGSGSPVVWGDQIFVQTAIPTGKKGEAVQADLPPPPPPPSSSSAASEKGGAEKAKRGKGGGGGLSTGKPTEVHQFVLMSLDLGTGAVRWQKTLRELVPHEGYHPADGTFASATPATDGSHVYAFFGSRGLYCLDMQGNVKWQKDLGLMRIRAGFGEGCSPVLFGDRLIVNWDHEGEDFIAVFDKGSGRELWRRPRDEETTWSTPIVVEKPGGGHQVVVPASRRIRSYDLETGAELWQCGGMTANVIPTAVAAPGVVYAISGYRGSALLALRTDRSGDLTGTDAVLWSYKKNTPYVPSPLLYEDRLYFFASNNATLTCCEAKSGKVLIDAAKLADLQGVYASPVGVAGRIYVVGRNGATAVLKAGAALEVLATNRLEDRIDASPAVVGGALLLRGREHLYCIAAK